MLVNHTHLLSSAVCFKTSLIKSDHKRGYGTTTAIPCQTAAIHRHGFAISCGHPAGPCHPFAILCHLLASSCQWTALLCQYLAIVRESFAILYKSLVENGKTLAENSTTNNPNNKRIAAQYIIISITAYTNCINTDY